MKKIFLLGVFIVFSSCSKRGDQRLAEQEKIRAEEQRNSQNLNQRQWSEKMETDLNKRKHFISALEGEFLGEMQIAELSLNVSAQFVSSIPIEYHSRVRTLEEINFELQNLSLNIVIKIENLRVNNSAVSCRIVNYRPDIVKGVINIISDSCKNIFKLAISDKDEIETGESSSNQARDLALKVVSNQIQSIDFINGTFESSVSTKKYSFKLKR